MRDKSRLSGIVRGRQSQSGSVAKKVRTAGNDVVILTMPVWFQTEKLTRAWWCWRLFVSERNVASRVRCDPKKTMALSRLSRSQSLQGGADRARDWCEPHRYRYLHPSIFDGLSDSPTCSSQCNDTCSRRCYGRT